ncbi:hypothetical protein AB0C68_15810 [Streptomyces tendae]|uniref:hypothetical protein n=1 Tax=Streptomyces tendae TaxID=1932 RepID=UPI0033E714B1
MVELHLRQLFCSLLDTPYAGVVAAGESVDNLINNCLALLQVRADIDPDDCSIVMAALKQVKAHMAQRNSLVHGLWLGYGGMKERQDPLLIVSKRRKADSVSTHTHAEAEALAQNLRSQGSTIFEWTVRVLPEALHREQVYPTPPRHQP